MKKLKQLYQRIRGRFPSALPKGSKEFDDFVDSILDIYNIPDLPSYRNAIATIIMHLGPITTHKAKKFFAASIHKAMANQVAYEKMQEIRETEKLNSTSAPESKSAVG